MRFATSVGGRVTGRHGNVIVIDDPIKPQGITDLSLSEAVRWKQETISSRLLPGGAVVLIMQRLHERDLAGHAEEEGGWDFLRLPMRFEEKERCSTSIGFVDPRKEEGDLLWPSYKTEHDVAEQEKDMGGRDGATVAAQLQQRPAPAKGPIFQKDWFKPYLQMPARFDFVVDSWDCTFKDTQDADFVVGQRWGMVGPNVYLLARWRGRWSFSRTLLEIEKSRGESGLPKPHATLVEDKANGTAVLDVLSKKVPGFIPVNPMGGKVARANAITPLYEAGNVWHPHKDIAPWIEDHEAELMKFPKGKNDDSVDAETQALAYLQDKASKFRAAMDRIAEEGLEQWFPI
jgi:predicted phage terminase large subunit-like protein